MCFNPIVIKYGINTFSLFGSYARGEANDDSDLDFVMDKGDLRGLQYVSLVQDLEDEFDCHVAVSVSAPSPIVMVAIAFVKSSSK